MTSAVPLKRLVSLLAQSMVTLAQFVDSPYPRTPTEIAVTSVLDKKYRVFFLEGMAAEVQDLLPKDVMKPVEVSWILLEVLSSNCCPGWSKTADCWL